MFSNLCLSFFRVNERPPSVSVTAHPEAGSLQSTANQEVAGTASQVLREMERLRTEMKMLLTVSSLTKYSAETNSSGEDCQRDRPVFWWLLFYGVCLLISSGLTSCHLQSEDSLRSSRPEPAHLVSASQQTESQPSQSCNIESHHTQSISKQSQTNQLQRRSPVPSMLEDASEVLRRVQRQRKLLEENLEALQRASSGEILECQLEALASNR